MAAPASPERRRRGILCLEMFRFRAEDVLKMCTEHDFILKMFDVVLKMLDFAVPHLRGILARVAITSLQSSSF